MKRLSKIAAIIALVVPSTAFGATIDQSVSFGGDSAFASDFFNSFTQYNGTETLTGVELIYNYSSSSNAFAFGCATYGDCAPSVADIALQGTGAFAGLSVSDASGTGITNATNGFQNGSFSLALNGSYAGLDLADFVGAGSVAGSIEADGGFDGYAALLGASHSGDLTLRYTTEIAPVPLPASMGMLLVSVAGLGIAGRRRKQS